MFVIIIVNKKIDVKYKSKLPLYDNKNNNKELSSGSKQTKQATETPPDRNDSFGMLLEKKRKAQKRLKSNDKRVGGLTSQDCAGLPC